MSLNHSSNAPIIKAGAIYDLLATAAVAVPPLAPLVIDLIRWIDGAMGFGTQFQPLDATSIFFFNLAGCFVIVWAVARLKFPSPEMGRMDAMLRFALVICQVWAVLMGATPVLLGIAAVLLVIGLLELRGEQTLKPSSVG